MRYSAEHKQNTHKTLLKVAAKSIRVDGPHRVGVAAVMAKAGLTHGGFYAHFTSKNALISAAIDQMFNESLAQLQCETQSLAPATALHSYIRFYLSRAHRDAKGVSCPVATLVSDLPRLHASARRRFAAGTRRLTDLLAGLLGQVGRVDADANADSLLAELIGTLALARAEPDVKRSDAILLRARRALIRRFNLEPSP